MLKLVSTLQAFANIDINDKGYPLLFEVYFIYRIDNHNENIFKILDCLETEKGKEFTEYIR